MADLYERKAFLIVGADLALEHPLLSFQIRANQRHHAAHIYVVTPRPVREDKYAAERPARRGGLLIAARASWLGRVGTGRFCSTTP